MNATKAITILITTTLFLLIVATVTLGFLQLYLFRGTTMTPKD